MTVNVMVPANGTLTLGTSGDVICQMVSVMIVPTQPDVRTETMCEVVVTPGQESFTMELDFLQDWHTTGISHYLWNHAGQTVAFTFEPTADGTPAMAGNLRVKRPTFGGAAGQHARDRMSLPLVGAPTSYTPDA